MPRQTVVSLLVILAMHWSLLDEYSTTPKKLRSIVNHIRHTGIHVVTLQEGIRLMNPERNNLECQR